MSILSARSRCNPCLPPRVAAERAQQICLGAGDSRLSATDLCLIFLNVGAGQTVEFEKLLQDKGENQVVLYRALATLKNLFWIQEEESQQTYEIHRLVQLSTHRRLGGDSRTVES